MNVNLYNPSYSQLNIKGVFTISPLRKCAEAKQIHDCPVIMSHNVLKHQEYSCVVSLS